jgi:hypothetical protein
MESVFAESDEHGMERHPEIIECKREKASAPLSPVAPNAPPGEGTAHPTDVRSKKPNIRYSGRVLHTARPMRSHKCNVQLGTRSTVPCQEAPHEPVRSLRGDSSPPEAAG